MENKKTYKFKAVNLFQKEKKTEIQKICSLATNIGNELLKHGAEMYRVELCMEQVCKAYGVSRVEAYSTPTLLILTVFFDDESYTSTKRIMSTHIDMDKIEKIGTLVLEIHGGKLSLEDATDKFEQLSVPKVYGFKMQVLTYFIIASAFAVFFGSTFLDGLIAGLISFLVLIVSRLLDKLDMKFFISAAICSFVISFSCRILGMIGILEQVDSTQIGLLMLVVPGIAIMNCMREFISGQLMSGCSRLVESLLTASAMAIGVIGAGILVQFF